MGRFDRYILSQLIILFGFFSLILVSVYWIEAAISLFDSLIAEGQGMRVFLEFSALTLPRIMLLVLPIAAFVATLYIFNRLISESELVVMQTAGFSALRLLRPVIVFALLMGVLVGILANVLAPAARVQYTDRLAEVQEDLTGRFLRAGEFVHPAPGLTVYIREISELGEFKDLFLQDSVSADGVEVIYTATTALLVRSEFGPRLIMFDGTAQTLDIDTGRLSTVQFADFTYDVAALVDEGENRRLGLRELPTLTLLQAGPEDEEILRHDLEDMLFEGHDRIARGLFAMFPPLIAATTLMLGTFSRFGVWRQILVAVVLVVPLQAIWNVAEATARRDAELFFLAYAQPAVAFLITVALIYLASAKRRSAPSFWRRGGGSGGGRGGRGGRNQTRRPWRKGRALGGAT